jgi:amidase
MNLCEASIADLRDALDSGRVTSSELTLRFLNRIARYDRQGIRLNAVPELNPSMFDEAHASDERRRRGIVRGPLDGIPYLAKASYAVRGLPVTSGSPAFAALIARHDAFVIARLRAAGAVLVGLTNMPPMAAGGMQRGLYGRAESPYNAAYLTAAFASGSSNGSGSGLAASFAAFALGEETWSSGRAPASCNALVAYTPSRGLISMRGNWPLIPTMDVVVPYARSVPDLLEILSVIVADDSEMRGDFWRAQDAVEIAPASSLRPADYMRLADPVALRGRRLGVPRMYIGTDHEARAPIATRAAVLDLWRRAAADLAALGAEIVETDFPLVSNYEGDRDGVPALFEQGLVPPEFALAEGEAIGWAWHDYLLANGAPGLNSLALIDGRMIVPPIPGAEKDRYQGIPDFTAYAEAARRGMRPLHEIPHLAAGLLGLEATRRRDLEDWMAKHGLDAVVFPALADVAPADADYNPVSADLAWRNGTWVANGNQVIRHCGVPTVTVPMGTMADIGMPVGLTFAGRGYDDAALLGYAYAFEHATRRRTAPPRTPPLPGDDIGGATRRSGAAPPLTLDAQLSAMDAAGELALSISGTSSATTIEVFVNGEPVPVTRRGADFEASTRVHFTLHYHLHSRWRGPYGSMVTALAGNDEGGGCAAAYRVVGGLG